MLLSARPKTVLSRWDHVVECALEVPSGYLELSECTGGAIALFTMPPGTYQLQVLFRNLDTIKEDGFEGDDCYRVILWPGSYIELRVLKQWKGLR